MSQKGGQPVDNKSSGLNPYSGGQKPIFITQVKSQASPDYVSQENQGKDEQFVTEDTNQQQQDSFAGGKNQHKQIHVQHNNNSYNLPISDFKQYEESGIEGTNQQKELQFQFMDADYQQQQERQHDSSSEIIQRPTHRRKKSQQPTLMTTKQKQQSNNLPGQGSNAPSSASNTNRQQQQHAQQPNQLSEQPTGDLSTHFRLLHQHHQYQQSLVAPSTIFEFQEEEGREQTPQKLKSNALNKNSNLNRATAAGSATLNHRNPLMIPNSASGNNLGELQSLESNSHRRGAVTKNSNLKDKIQALESRTAAVGHSSSASSYQQMRTADQVEHQKFAVEQSRQLQTLSPKLQQHFTALNQVRENVRNVIGFDSATSLSSIERSAKNANASSQGSSANSNLKRLTQNVNKEHIAGPHKKSAIPQISNMNPPAKNLLGQNRQSSHHKRNQTKTHLPIAQLLPGAGSQQRFPNNGGIQYQHQKHATIDHDFPQVSPFTQSHPLLPIESSSLNNAAGGSISSSTLYNNDSGIQANQSQNLKLHSNNSNQVMHSIPLKQGTLHSHTAQPSISAQSHMAGAPQMMSAATRVGTESGVSMSQQSDGTVAVNQLMKRHFRNPKGSEIPSNFISANHFPAHQETNTQIQEDPKTAYLRHAKGAPHQSHNNPRVDQSESKKSGSSLVIMNSGATSVQHSQQFNHGETPQRPLVATLGRGIDGSSNAKQQSHSSQSGAPKRVTFDAPQADSSDSQRNPQFESGINEEEDEESSQQSYNVQGEPEEVDEQMISYLLHEEFSEKNSKAIKYQQRQPVQVITGGGSEEDEGLECEDAPTVVIDESQDDNNPTSIAQFLNKHVEDEASHEYGNNSSGGIRMIKENKPSSTSQQHHQFLDNIQAALQSIRNQEAQEKENPDSKQKKKGVTIMSIEEEQALINQINEIRDRIRRGETVAQKNQQQNQAIVEDELEQMESFNEYGVQSNNNMGQINQPGIINKPPLYSLTFLNPDLDPQDFGNEVQESQIQSQQKQRSSYSIDNGQQNINCLIVTDGPNIYEKKRQRFERIQKMRHGATSADSGNSDSLNSRTGAAASGPQMSNFQSNNLNAIQEYGTVVNLLKHNDPRLLNQQVRPSDAQNLTPVNANAQNINFRNMIVGNPKQKGSDVQQPHSNKRLSDGKTKKNQGGGTNKIKSYSQKQIKNVAATNHGIINHIQVKRPAQVNKSRQNSTIDQLVHSLTSQSQNYSTQGAGAYQGSHKNVEMQVVNLTNLGAANSISTKSQSILSNNRGGHHVRHPTVLNNQLSTLERCDNSSQMIDGINQQAANTYRPKRTSGIGLNSATYDEDDEDLQIQLYSLRKVIASGNQQQFTSVEKSRPQARPQTTSAVNKKKTVSKSRKGTASIHIPGTALGFGVMASAKSSIVVPSIQYPGTVIHQKGKSISNNFVSKNNRSNLMINVHEPAAQHQHMNPHHTIPSSSGGQTLSHSLSLKRLKTPKMKDVKEELHLHTPLMEQQQQLLHQMSKVTNQFQSVLPQSTLGNHALYQQQQQYRTPGGQISAKNNQQPVLNYQTNATVVHNVQKSPFVYPQTSKATTSGSIGKHSNYSGGEQQQRSSNKRGGAHSSSHVKQKSVQINSSNQLGTSAHHSRGNTRGNGIEHGNDSSVRSGSTHKVGIEPKAINKLMKTKRETDQAFETMKRRINEKPLLPPSINNNQIMQSPQMLQPAKNISQVTTITTNSNQILPSSSSFQASLQDLPTTTAHKYHKPTQSIVVIPTKHTPIFGPQESLSSRTKNQYESNAQQSINDFERNYKKLSGMLDKIFL